MKKIILPLLLAAILAGPADAGVYTIDQYLDLVARHSKDLKQAEQDVESAAATKKEAMSGALPHLSARAGYNRNLTDQYMYASLDPESDEVAKFRINRDNDYSAGAVLSQTLFSGTVFNAIKAAKQYEQLIDNVYDASYRQILTVAQQSYYQALLLKVVWEVAQKSEQNALENYEDVKGAFENGLVSEFGLLQAEARYKDAVPQTTAAERNYRIALIGLQNLAGISVDEEIILDGDLEQYPELPPAKELETVLGDRPDYSALLWEEKLRNTNVQAERSGYLPTLTGSLAYAYSASSDGWNFDEDNSAWVLGFNLSVPIFSGGATRARVQQARIDLNKSRIGIARPGPRRYP